MIIEIEGKLKKKFLSGSIKGKIDLDFPLDFFYDKKIKKEIVSFLNSSEMKFTGNITMNGETFKL